MATLVSERKGCTKLVIGTIYSVLFEHNNSAVYVIGKHEMSRVSFFLCNELQSIQNIVIRDVHACVAFYNGILIN